MMSFALRPVTRFCLGALIALISFEVMARVAATTMEHPLRWYDATAELKIEQMAELGQADIVIAGSSMPWQGFQAAMLASDNSSAYNSSLSGGVPSITSRWLEEEVLPQLRPNTVIWGLSSLDFAPNYGQMNLERYEDARESAPGVLAEAERQAAQRLALVSHRTHLRDPSVIFADGDSSLAADRRDAQSTTLRSGDRSTAFPSNTTAELASVQRERLADFEIDDADAAVIEAVTRRMVDQGIRVVLVEMPVPQRFVSLHPGGAASYEAVGDEISRIGQAAGAEVFLASDWFDDTSFVDFTHLDLEAATTLTNAMASYLTTGVIIEPEPLDEPVVEEEPTVVETEPLQGCEARMVLDEYENEVEALVCPNGIDPEDLEDPEILVVRNEDERVAEGSGGWLFYAPSVQQPCLTENHPVLWHEEVELTRQILASLGKRLVIGIIPDRGIVADEFLGSIDNSCQVTNHELITRLAADHPSVLSLHTVVDSPELVRKTDTHWNPAGALAGARAIVEAVDASAWDANSLTTNTPFENLSDLVEFSGGTDTAVVEYQGVAIEDVETTSEPAGTFPLYRSQNPGGVPLELLLLHDSNGGHDDEPGLAADYIRPWFSEASTVRGLAGDYSPILSPATGEALRDADVLSLLFVQRSTAAWLGPGRLSVGVLHALADRFETIEYPSAIGSLPAQDGDGVLIIHNTSTPSEIEVTATSGRLGHRIDGPESSAMHVSAGTEIVFSEPVSVRFVPLDQFQASN